MQELPRVARIVPGGKFDASEAGSAGSLGAWLCVEDSLSCFARGEDPVSSHQLSFPGQRMLTGSEPGRATL